MLAGLIIGLAATTAASIVPSGKWAVEYAADACLLQRTFADGTDRITFGLRRERGDPGYEVFVVTPGEASSASSGVAHMRLAPGAQRVKADYVAGPLVGRGARLTTFPLGWSDLGRMRSAERVSIQAGPEVDVTIALSQVDLALDALAKCGADLDKAAGGA